MQLLCGGSGNEQIAQVLDIALNTLRIDRWQILRKLGFSLRTRAVLKVNSGY